MDQPRPHYVNHYRKSHIKLAAKSEGSATQRNRVRDSESLRIHRRFRDSEGFSRDSLRFPGIHADSLRFGGIHPRFSGIHSRFSGIHSRFSGIHPSIYSVRFTLDSGSEVHPRFAVEDSIKFSPAKAQRSAF